MRLAYLAPAVLGLFLVGCGNDEPERVTPPPATEQPAPPATAPATPPADGGAATGTMQNDTQTGPMTEDEPVMQDSPPAGTGGMNDPQSGGTTAPGTTGTGTGTGTGASQ